MRFVIRDNQEQGVFIKLTSYPTCMAYQVAVSVFTGRRMGVGVACFTSKL